MRDEENRVAQVLLDGAKPNNYDKDFRFITVQVLVEEAGTAGRAIGFHVALRTKHVGAEVDAVTHVHHARRIDGGGNTIHRVGGAYAGHTLGLEAPAMGEIAVGGMGSHGRGEGAGHG